jgi:phospholipid/cholesterol/gamma-HCH transport system permease protein
LAIGLSVTAQLIFIVQVFAEDADVVRLLVELVALELGSLVTAFVLIGRSGSAIAIDLGNISLHREAEGLEILGINVNDFFVLPRLGGMAISQLVLAVYFSTLAIVTGIAFAAMLESTTNFKYLFAVASAFDLIELAAFVVKNLLFGLIIGATACFHGLNVGVSATEVPQEAQRAIVNALILVFLLDGVFALVLH